MDTQGYVEEESYQEEYSDMGKEENIMTETSEAGYLYLSKGKSAIKRGSDTPSFIVPPRPLCQLCCFFLTRDK